MPIYGGYRVKIIEEGSAVTVVWGDTGVREYVDVSGVEVSKDDDRGGRVLKSLQKGVVEHVIPRIDVVHVQAGSVPLDEEAKGGGG